MFSFIKYLNFEVLKNLNFKVLKNSSDDVQDKDFEILVGI